MKICTENTTQVTKPSIQLIPGHIYQYEDKDWYYIYGKESQKGKFTNLTDDGIWNEENNEDSISNLTDVTDQYCLQKVK